MDASKLGRFCYYAPLIKQLEVCDPKGRKYQVEVDAWDAILLYSSKNSLLPNLKGLTVTHNNSVVLKDIPYWIRIFLSPDLRSIKACGPLDKLPPCINPPDAVELTDQIVRRCPLLEELALPHARIQLVSYNGFLTVYLGNNALLYEPLARAQNITSLTTDGRVLNSASLQVIGRLPRLERLNLRTCLQTTAILFTPDPVLDLLPDLFPALEHLYIDWANPSEIKNIWNIKQLVQGLTTVDIHMNPSAYLGYSPPLFLSDIARASPRIDTLTVRSLVLIYITPDMLKPLFQFPLRSLSLSGFELGAPAEFCPILGEALPLLHHLQLKGWNIDFMEFAWFSKLPQLNSLDIRFDWQLVERRDPCPEEPIPPSATLRTLGCNPLPSIIFSDDSLVRDISR